MERSTVRRRGGSPPDKQLISKHSSSTESPLTLPSIRVPMDSNDLQRRGSDRECRDSRAKCIESLPVELQRQIMLCLPSLGSLGAMIRASPVFYSLFQSEPKNFIANCLVNILGDAFHDACTARAAMQESFQKQRRDGMNLGHEPSIIWPFLDSHRKRVEELPCNSWIHSISLPEAIEMAVFHSSTVEPLVERYAAWALANLSVKPTSLSRTERMRIQRAMYRFQIVCDVFGNKLNDDNPHLTNQRPGQLGCLRFLSSYEPWEIEEILCINLFMQEEYQKRIQEVSGDLNSIVWRYFALSPFTGGPLDGVDPIQARTLREEKIPDTWVNHADTVYRHKTNLTEPPRESRTASFCVGVTHPRSQRARRYLAHPYTIPFVPDVAR